MFSLTIKINKKWVLLGFCAVAVAMLGVLAGTMVVKPNTEEVFGGIEKKIGSVKLEDNEQRVAFLKKLGWEVQPQPSETVNILIPQSFDKVYEKYNQLQRKQGFNLGKYKGKTVTRYTYIITNVPENKVIVADLFFFKDKLVAGDINNVALDGYMIGLNQKLPEDQ